MKGILKLNAKSDNSLKVKNLIKPLSSKVGLVEEEEFVDAFKVNSR